MTGQPLSSTDGASLEGESVAQEVPNGYVAYEFPTLTLQRPTGFATALLVLSVLVPTLLPYLLILSTFVTESWPTWSYDPVWFMSLALMNALAFIWWSRRIVFNGRLLGATTWLRTRYIVAYLAAVAVSSILRFEPLVFLPAQAVVAGASFVVWWSLWRVSDAAPTRRVSVLIVIKTVALAAASLLYTIIWSVDRINAGLLSQLLLAVIVDFAHVALTIAVVLAISTKQKRRLAVAPPTDV